VSYRSLAIVLAVVCVSCKQPARPQAARPGAGGPQIDATVVTIRTVVQPESAARAHTIVIAGDRARDLSETDVWRLFDVKAATVTTVDDIARTVRTDAVASLVNRRRLALRASLPAHYPRADIADTGEKRQLLGTEAAQSLITTGQYRRELWIGRHPAIPDTLYSMMVASEPLTSPLAPAMRAVDDAFLTMRGFPLLDRSELPLAKEKMVVERSVTSIARRKVPEAVLTVPKDYLDLTPKPPARK
jgi:hypothetical protein